MTYVLFLQGGRRADKSLWQIDNANLDRLRKYPSLSQIADNARDATIDWRKQPGTANYFPRGQRGTLFAPPELLPYEEETGGVDDGEAFITWQTKRFMWKLHRTNPDKWNARTIAQQFGVKIPQAESCLRLFEVSLCALCCLCEMQT